MNGVCSQRGLCICNAGYRGDACDVAIAGVTLENNQVSDGAATGAALGFLILWGAIFTVLAVLAIKNR